MKTYLNSYDNSCAVTQAAKLSRYCRQQTLALVMFILFFISWVVMRLIYFPCWIIRRSGR